MRDIVSAEKVVIAGSGGHAAPPNFGGCLFDFADAAWKRIDNANGMPWMVRELDSPGKSGEINSFGEINYPGVSAGIPAPAHLYGNVLPLPAANGGGARGSALILRSAAAAYWSNSGSGYSHRFDLSTGLWSRLSTNVPVANSGFRTACHDPVTTGTGLVRAARERQSLLPRWRGLDLEKGGYRQPLRSGQQ